MAALYKNAPLVNTAFEARFFGDLAIETRRDQFQRAVKADFPILYVPNAAPGKAPALQHYQFRSKDDSARVSLAVNSFVYATSRYSGFLTFKADLEKVWKPFSELFDIPVFTRLGLRYTNHLPIIRDESGTIPLSRYVTANFNVTAGFATGKIHDMDLSISCDLPGGRLLFLMQNEKREGGLEVLIVDFDFSHHGEINREDRRAFIETAHERIEAVFLDLISEEHKQIMKGGTQ
jgi:uncharacterized protein (TIGR04255 family)